MCGRMSAVFTAREVESEFDIDVVLKDFSPRYNLAPSQFVPVIVAGSRVLDLYRWGFIPHWMKDKPKFNLINTKAETITEKRSFKDAFQDFRCIILTSGFYEWQGKKPFYFKVKDKDIFAFAGIASFYTDEKGDKVGTCSIITTESNDMIKKFHQRMPVILDKEQFDSWIDPKNKDPDILKSFLRPYPSEKMDFYAVSDKVNSVKNESPDLINPSV